MEKRMSSVLLPLELAPELRLPRVLPMPVLQQTSPLLKVLQVMRLSP
jgi:hypothetical protein